jgi:hypothetical protein
VLRATWIAADLAWLLQVSIHFAGMGPRECRVS